MVVLWEEGYSHSHGSQSCPFTLHAENTRALLCKSTRHPYGSLLALVNMGLLCDLNAGRATRMET